LDVNPCLPHAKSKEEENIDALKISNKAMKLTKSQAMTQQPVAPARTQLAPTGQTKAASLTDCQLPLNSN